MCDVFKKEPQKILKYGVTDRRNANGEVVGTGMGLWIVDSIIQSYKVYGTQIIKDINEILPDFTCFLLTNFTEQGINEKIVQKVFVQDKAIFAEEDDSQEFRNFVNKIKNSVECFRKRLEVTKLEYEKLVEKKKERQISASEEDRFIYLYKVLSSYDYVDKMPDILVRNSTQDTLEDMLATLKELKQCLRKE